MSNVTTNPTKVKIACRISFANIWSPKSVNGSEARSQIRSRSTKSMPQSRQPKNLAVRRSGEARFPPVRISRLRSETATLRDLMMKPTKTAISSTQTPRTLRRSLTAMFSPLLIR